jgi:hypothetical protein
MGNHVVVVSVAMHARNKTKPKRTIKVKQVFKDAMISCSNYDYAHEPEHEHE